MTIVQGWYKKWSVWALGVCIAIAELAPYLPEVQENLPADWYRTAFLIVLAARVVTQRNEG
jgi:hypothetical protein